MKVDVLNLEWTSFSSRDRNSATLVCNYLRYRGLHVVEGCVFKGFELIDKYHPQLFFITNGVGASINFQLVKYASLKGIKAVTLVSEGNYRDSALEDFIWGWNKDHVIYEDMQMQWSGRTKALTLKRCPEFDGRIKVSGGVGFDFYKIAVFNNRKDFLVKFGKEQYEKIIGIGCWSFSSKYPGGYGYNHDALLFGEDELIRFREDRDNFNRIIIKIVQDNPSILFLFKEHPGNLGGYYMSGIEGTEKYPNVLIVKKEPIADCIAASDFWLTYESTTVIEAWLLNKQTCLLNPSGIDFPRANVHLGSPNYPDIKSLQNAIDVFYASGFLPEFHELQAEREHVIHETIQWDDGLNHARAGNEIIHILNDNKKKTKGRIPLELNIDKWRQLLASGGFPWIKNTSTYKQLKKFDVNELKNFAQAVYNRQIAFYEKNKLSMNDLKKIKAV